MKNRPCVNLEGHGEPLPLLIGSRDHGSPVLLIQEPGVMNSRPSGPAARGQRPAGPNHTAAPSQDRPDGPIQARLSRDGPEGSRPMCLVSLREIVMRLSHVLKIISSLLE